MINSFIFPAPEKSSYTVNSLHEEFAQFPAAQSGIRLIAVHIPPLSSVTRTSTPSPHSFGVLLQHPSSPFLVIYAHPNAVDVGIMLEEMSYFARKAQVSVLLWEYHGYGILQDDVDVVGSQSDAPEPGEEVLLDGITAVYRYVVHDLQVPPSQIILMGRSIGSGPSTWLASQTSIIASRVEAATGSQTSDVADDSDGSSHVQLATQTILDSYVSGTAQMSLPPLRPPLLLFLQAPFASIVECVRSVLAQQRINLSFLQPLAGMIIADRFRNADRIASVDSHIVIQHGDQDSIVPYDHALRLVQSATSAVGNSIGSTSRQQQGSRSGRDGLVHLHTSKGYGHNNLSAHEATQVMLHMLKRDSLKALWSPHPLNIRVPLYHHAHQSLYEKLSAGLAGAGRGTWTTLAEFQNSFFSYVRKCGADNNETPRQRAETKLRSRSSTATLLVCSIASFVCRLAHVWSYVRPIERKMISAAAQSLRSTSGGRVALSDRASLQRVFEEFISINGSPLGVYDAIVCNAPLETARQLMADERDSAFVVFGLLFSTDATPNPSNHTVELGNTLLELRWPLGLVRDVLCIVEMLVMQTAATPLPTTVASTAKDSSEASDGLNVFDGNPLISGSAETVPFVLSRAHVDRLQLHVERLTGHLPDVEWAAAQQLVRNLFLRSVDDQTVVATAPPTSDDTIEAIRHDELVLIKKRDATLEEWNRLLLRVRKLATQAPGHSLCGVVVRQDETSATVASLDPCWTVARDLHREVLKRLRLSERAESADPSHEPHASLNSPLSAATTTSNRKKSDEDCCVM
ncbi:serine peptidase, putative [Bodo saltans]|uniref:Serine peptidase, putative n=1 Tax=Bodo saltans TaxID=75058 RepID=A0A0S4IVT2_BODSA|nr:serine peptidase, putative [Bodo saltans]|eukprot:CUF60913.1 serine peptidase, putative [Bodo saltans]